MPTPQAGHVHLPVWRPLTGLPLHTVMFHNADKRFVRFSTILLSTRDCCNQSSRKSSPWTPVTQKKFRIQGPYNCGDVCIRGQTVQRNTVSEILVFMSTGPSASLSWTQTLTTPTRGWGGLWRGGGAVVWENRVKRVCATRDISSRKRTKGRLKRRKKKKKKNPYCWGLHNRLESGWSSLDAVVGVGGGGGG